MSVSSLRSFEYLEQLPGTVFRRLYKEPSTALAIFRRMLSHLAKSFVMAMLFVDNPLLTSDLESLVRPSSKREKEHALSLLSRLHIMTVGSEPGQPQALKLTASFAESLRLALTGGGKHNSFGVIEGHADNDHVSVDGLDEYARSQWEGILHYMVGSTGVGMKGQGEGPSQGVKKLLQLGGLVEAKGKSAEITQSGFSFLLQEVNAQVWTLMVDYLENAEGRYMDPVDVLSFLFMLASLELGEKYSTASLTPTQTQMIDDLRDLGIIYQHASQSSSFYPTRLATTLTSDAGALRSVSAGFDNALKSAEGKGFIVVETNYRIYAYTSSPLQIAVLALFTRLSTRYPNMVSGRITRESIRRAIAFGITSDQITGYLSTHAHPQLQKRAPVLPPTVVDQIRLWQIEGERMKASTGFLFKDFVNFAEYEGPCNYADEIGVRIWKSDAKRMFFVTRHEQIAAYLRSRSKKAA